MTIREALRLYPAALAWATSSAPLNSVAEAALGRALGYNHAGDVLPGIIARNVMQILATAYYDLAERDRRDMQDTVRRDDRLGATAS